MSVIESNPQMLIALGALVCGATGILHLAATRIAGTVRKAINGNAPLRGKGEEFVTTKDALWFPVTGSAMLLSLYAAIKYLPKEVLTGVITAYMTTVSVGGLAGCLRPVLGASIPLGIACCGLGALYVWTKHWVLNNIFAVALSVVAIEVIPIQSFAVSALLLSLLFFYDIFWVFGTDVMVTVATNIQGPIKILFPQAIFSDDHTKKSLLGLGDIVLPGFFIAQMLRMSLLKSGGKDTFYYRVAMVAYVLSLLNTMGVMVIFNHAQPALLYIVPWLLVSVVLTATARGEMWDVVSFDEEAFEANRLRAIAAETGAAAPSDAAPVESSEGATPAEPEPGFLAQMKEAFLAVFGQDAEWKERTASRKTVAAAKKAQ
jgi:minor histocompatibility antigen H13